MSVVLIRSLILYIVVIFGVRLMGKRQLGELQPSELVITILISNIATLPLEDTSIPLILGILPILTLVCFEALMSWVTLKSCECVASFPADQKSWCGTGRSNRRPCGICGCR